MEMKLEWPRQDQLVDCTESTSAPKFAQTASADTPVYKQANYSKTRGNALLANASLLRVACFAFESTTVAPQLAVCYVPSDFETGTHFLTLKPCLLVCSLTDYQS